MTPNEELYYDIIGTAHESEDLFLEWRRRAALSCLPDPLSRAEVWLLPPYGDPFWAAWRREGQLEEKAWGLNPRRGCNGEGA